MGSKKMAELGVARRRQAAYFLPDVRGKFYQTDFPTAFNLKIEIELWHRLQNCSAIRPIIS